MKHLLVPACAALALLSCDPQSVDPGLGKIATLQTPADDPALGCLSDWASEGKASERAACTFGRGARVADTLGIAKADAAKLPIRHVIVLMKENRSFDQLLGYLHDHGQPDTAAVPASFTNPDLKGVAVAPFHATTTCLSPDPGHQSESMQACVNGGKMDGFVTNAANTTGTDGHHVMGMYDETDLPFYYFLANTFALNDAHFATMAGGTFANRNLLLLGTTAGTVDTGIVFPEPQTASLLQALLAHGYTWGAYTNDMPFSGTLNWKSNAPGVHTMEDLYKALDDGTLPNVAFVDGKDSIDDDHPPSDLQKGEAWSKKVYDHVVTSPQWNRLAMLWTYDEVGAMFDHVPPPPGTCPEAGSPFKVRGARVPFVAISPWAKRHYVSHQVQDHMAITRFIELLFDLPALDAAGRQLQRAARPVRLLVREGPGGAHGASGRHREVRQPALSALQGCDACGSPRARLRGWRMSWPSTM